MCYVTIPRINNNLMHKFLFYNKFIVFLYMFQAMLCSSSGGEILYYTTSGIITPVGGRPVRTYRVWRYQMLYNTIWPPDDEHNSDRNM